MDAEPTDRDEHRAHHDMGGVSRYQCLPVDPEPHHLTPFDREVDALRQMLSAKGLMSVDELRRGIEAIPAGDYDRLGYYERWIRSMAATLIRKGVIEERELEGRLAKR